MTPPSPTPGRSEPPRPAPNRGRNAYRWAAPGDINAFFGLALDNLADLVLAVSLLATVFQFPVDFALSHFVPGTAVGVVVGDLLFT